MSISSGIICVKDVMTGQVVALSPDATPRDLARVLTEYEISGVPVIDHDNQVIGVVSKTDLLQWCVKGGLGFGANDLLVSLADGGIDSRLEMVDLGIVADFMTSRPITIGSDESLAEAAHRMAKHQVHRLIIVDRDGRLNGIVTSMDLLRAYPASRQCAVA